MEICCVSIGAAGWLDVANEIRHARYELDAARNSRALSISVVLASLLVRLSTKRESNNNSDRREADLFV